MNIDQRKFRPSVLVKIICGILGAAALLPVLLVVAILNTSKGGYDVVKGQPDRAFQRYVLDVIPPGIKVLSAEGRAYPMFGGVNVKFRLQIDPKELDALIALKRLEPMEVANPRAFGTNDLTKWKKPEFYSGSTAPPGMNSSTWRISLAVDRETGAAIYSTGGD